MTRGSRPRRRGVWAERSVLIRDAYRLWDGGWGDGWATPESLSLKWCLYGIPKTPHLWQGTWSSRPRRHLRYAAVEHGEASLTAAGKHMEYCPARHHPETRATAHRDESMVQMAGLLLARQHATLGKTTLRMRRRNLFFFPERVLFGVSPSVFRLSLSSPPKDSPQGWVACLSATHRIGGGSPEY